jgi:hypothetical protein
MTDGARCSMTYVDIIARSRMTYANMTPEQREKRRKQQRLYNKSPFHKEAMKVTRDHSREVWRHALNSESITMENPLFNPKMEWPTTNSSGPHGPTVSPSDWDIPESSTTPICFPQATEETNDDDDCGDILSAHKSHRQNVPSGQRRALLAHRNNVFECRIGQNTREANDDDECMTRDHMDENTPLPQSTVTNNGK